MIKIDILSWHQLTLNQLINLRNPKIEISNFVFIKSMFENSDNMLKLFLELGIDKKKVFNLGYLLKETKPLY